MWLTDWYRRPVLPRETSLTDALSEMAFLLDELFWKLPEGELSQKCAELQGLVLDAYEAEANLKLNHP